MLKELYNKVEKHLPKKVKLFAETVKAGYRVGAMEADITDVSDQYLGRMVLLCDDAVLAATGIKDMPNAIVNPKLEIIFVNTAFQKMPQAARQAVIAHEAGHTAHKHRIKPQDIFKRMLGFESAVIREKEADAYAAQTGHREGLINFLCSTRETFKTNKYNTKELDKRIAALQSDEWKQYKW